MFLHTRLLSEPRAGGTLILGLVFAAGLTVGVFLRPVGLAGTADAQAGPASAITSPDHHRIAIGGHPAEVLRVNDGDTFEARVHVWPGMQITTKVRLRGIDAAEFNARCSEEYRMAQAARDALQRLLAEGGVTVSRIDLDKYGGRVVAGAATRNTPDISSALLQAGVVRGHDGGRRQSWCDQASSRERFAN